jgi:peroxiredoxin
MKASLILLLLTLVSMGSIAQSKELVAGDRAPSFAASNQRGKMVSLSDMLAQGKTVVIFYRGYWCPYCNKQLKDYEDSMQLIKAKGANILAITPELPDYVQKTIAKTKASFNIISDKDQSIMKSYGVAFTLDEQALVRLERIGVNLKEINGNNSNMLPVPGVFVVNQQGIIEYVYFDPNYRNRLSVKELLTHL